MSNKPMEEGKGVLFSNDKKGNERAPDFKGQMLHNGEIIKISAWKRQSAYGELISLARNDFKPGDKFPKEVKSTYNDEDVPFN